MEIKIKFSANIYIEGDSYEEIKRQWESMSIFSVDALDCGAEFSEELLIEDANTGEDLKQSGKW